MQGTAAGSCGWSGAGSGEKEQHINQRGARRLFIFGVILSKMGGQQTFEQRSIMS